MHFLLIIDNYSRMTWVFTMKEKSGAFKFFKHQTILRHNQTRKKVKCLKTDNGFEFCHKQFNEFYKEGIARQHIVQHTPQQNEVTERMNKTLLERTKCMLSNSGFNTSFWAEAVNTTYYLANCSPSSAIDYKTPIKVWSNKPSKYSMLKVFGCLAYYHVSGGKLKPKAKKELFIGYGDGVKGF